MKQVLVKICGVNSAEAFDAVVAAGAEYLAFNFFEKSPRYVTPAEAAALSARHVGGPQRVALLVQPDDAAVDAVVAALQPHVLQLYAPPARVAELRARTGLQVWRAVGVSAQSDLPTGTEGADLLLIEANPPKGSDRPGGNAASFDWDILAGWTPGFDWMLAGGLTPDNVAEAIARSGAPAVDVSSGVESAPGVKDAALIRAFIRAARG